MSNHDLFIDTAERQKKYVERMKASQGALGIVFAEAFVRGMREIGYKNPGWALAELVDNSFQGGAGTVEVRFGYDADNKGKAKPDQIAIIDDGNGMLSDMISYAIRWGGTDRENNRKGFGRFGYGLPSAAVSMARRYTVYSKLAEDGWYAVTVDLDELATVAGDIAATETLLEAHKSNPPEWIKNKGGDIDIGSLASGTIVVLENLDRLKRTSGWVLQKALQAKLLSQFGVIYRHWLPDYRIVVDGLEVQAVDPLFQMEHGRFYDANDVRPEIVKPYAFEIGTDSGEKGTVRVRASILPPDFQLKNPEEYKKGGAKTNERHPIMKQYNGISICREGRQIDVIDPRWTRFQTYDRNIKIELDFDPVLDEHFGITTSKQQIVISEDMWEKIEHAGANNGNLRATLADMRRRFTKLQDELQAKAEQRGEESETPRPSEEAMKEVSKFKTRHSSPSRGQIEDANKNLEKEAEKVAKSTGKSVEDALGKLLEESKEASWRLKFEAIDEGPFFLPKRIGPNQRWLVINTAHPFFKKVYQRAPEVRYALEVLLFVIGEHELDAQDEREKFYKSERNSWSELLRHGLDDLLDDASLIDSASMKMEVSDAEDEKAT